MTIRCEKLARDERAMQNLSITCAVWNSWEPPSQAGYIIKTQVKIHSSLRILSCHSCAGLKKFINEHLFIPKQGTFKQYLLKPLSNIKISNLARQVRFPGILGFPWNQRMLHS